MCLSGVVSTKSYLTYEARMPSKCPGWVRSRTSIVLTKRQAHILTCCLLGSLPDFSTNVIRTSQSPRGVHRLPTLAAGRQKFSSSQVCLFKPDHEPSVSSVFPKLLALNAGKREALQP